MLYGKSGSFVAYFIFNAAYEAAQKGENFTTPAREDTRWQTIHQDDIGKAYRAVAEVVSLNPHGSLGLSHRLQAGPFIQRPNCPPCQPANRAFDRRPRRSSPCIWRKGLVGERSHVRCGEGLGINIELPSFTPHGHDELETEKAELGGRYGSVLGGVCRKQTREVGQSRRTKDVSRTYT